MYSKFTYLLIDLLTIIIPFAFSFHPKINFYKTWKAFWPANISIAFVFILWDIGYTHLGVWGFNDHYICGLKFFNLPIEEILFFICIPYSSIFTYYCFRIFFHKLKFKSTILSTCISVGLLITGFIFFSKLYTAATCISLSALIIYLTYIKKAEWLTHFFFTYLVILLPFFIVNGILTGSWIDEPIVWYNDQENLKVRLLTIPIEDVFYGMLLLLLNTWLYERFTAKTS